MDTQCLLFNNGYLALSEAVIGWWEGWEGVRRAPAMGPWGHRHLVCPV